MLRRDSAVVCGVGGNRQHPPHPVERGWTEPPIIWAAIVGESGTLKTPAFKLAMQPIRARQNAAFKRHAAEVATFESATLQYEKDLTLWKRDKNTTDDPPERPDPPCAERFVVNDTTVEALAPILLENPQGLLLSRDELAGWVGSFDRYSAGRGGDAPNWLSMHNGEALTVDRKTGRRVIHVPSAAVAIVGGIQPGTLRRVMGAEHHESGLLGRLLFAMPPRRAKRWTEDEISPSTTAGVGRLFDRLYELQPDQDADGDPIPRSVRLTPDAKRLWVSFVNEHGREQVEMTGDLSAAWSKLEGYAARLALIVHCVRAVFDDPTLADSDEVDRQSVEAGVALSRWFGHEAKRVYGLLAESDEDCERRVLAEWIALRGGSVTVNELAHGLRQFRGAGDDARTALAELVACGAGRWVSETSPKGGRPAERFQLATTVTETTSVDPVGGGYGDGDTGDGCDGECGDDPPLGDLHARIDGEGTPDDTGGEWGAI